MSFLFGQNRSQPTSEEKIRQAEQEIDIYTEMFNKVTTLCATKCIPSDYRESELNKGESVCLDRCVAKFFECNMKISEKMQELGGQAAGAGPGTPGGGLFGR